MIIKLFTILQYVLPKKIITKILGYITNCKKKWVTKLLIKTFIYIYKIDIKEIDKQNINEYSHFNKFFTRKLKKNARKIDNNSSNAIITPVDGVIIQLGNIQQNKILHAKNNFYNLKSLLANHKTITKKFFNGKFVNIYLRPKDYHRVHTPCDGTLIKIIHIPGKLFSVKPKITKNIPNIFTKNERIICLFKTKFGLMAQILIGSIIVGSIETIWTGIIKNKNTIKYWNYKHNKKNKTFFVKKGQEIGKFLIGSTVIILFTKNKISFLNTIYPDKIVKMGQKIANKKIK